MLQVFSASATNVVATHHWHPCWVHMAGGIKTNNCFDKCPDCSRESVNKIRPNFLNNSRSGKQNISEKKFDQFVDAEGHQESYKGACLVSDIHHWCKSNKWFYLLTKVRIIDVCDPELSCSLWMPEVSQFLNTSGTEDEVNICWHIVLTHLIEWEVPIGLLMTWKRYVFIAHRRPSIISQPEVVAFFRKHVSGWVLVEEPGASDIYKAVLHKQSLLITIRFELRNCILTPNMPECVDVPIFSCHFVTFELKALGFDLCLHC